MNPSVVLILAVVCFFIGMVVAFLLQSLRDIKKPAEAGPQQVVDGQPLPEPTPGQSHDLLEVARIWKDKSSHLPVLEIGGNLFHKAEEVHPEQVDQLNSAISELCDWLGQNPPTPPLAAKVPAFLRDEPFSPPKITPPTRRGPLEILRNSLDADVRSAMKSTPKSLAAQVDDVLQEMLAESNLAGRGIRIMDTPSADLVMMVGLNKYDGIEAVPDPEVQAIIREAVAEWGRRAYRDPGLAD